MDNLTTLTFSMQANKGIYALLLGSGISRSAGIPTGWDIVLDLIKKIAIAKGSETKKDPLEWYLQEYGKEPNYSELLNMVAQTPSERQHVLERYFEPTEEEREDGLKMPTQAHKAIAKLVKDRYVKVIITTNFDRLLEIALQDEGITPTVISNADSVKGAVPIVHSSCTILKLHGDYKDTRIKNTNNELEKYDIEIDKYLDRIFDEFGLIICGWSADWDIALRDSLYRRKNRRYPTYWTSLQTPRGSASDLFSFLLAEQILIENADSFFNSLYEKVHTLSVSNENNPISIKTTIAMLKKYIPRPEHRIQLYDLVNNEVKRVIQSCSEIANSNIRPDSETIQSRLLAYEKSVEVLAHLYAHGCFYDNQHYDIWHKRLNDIANFSFPINGGYTVWINMVKYPAMKIYYIACMSCLFSKNYKTLFQLTQSIKTKDRRYDNTLLSCTELHPFIVFENLSGNEFDKPNHLAPASDYMHDITKKYFADIIFSNEEFSYCFDTFEYLNGLLWFEKMITPQSQRIWAPTGRFYYSRNSRMSGYDKDFFENNEMLDCDDLLQHGFWNGDETLLGQCRDGYNGFIKS